MSIQAKTKSNEYYTPKSAWENIIDYLPKDIIYYEPFNNIKNPKSIASRQDLIDLGLTLLDKPPYNEETKENDFFLDDGKDYDAIIGNPPFSIKRNILQHIKKLNKPFVLLLPSTTINTQYMRNMFRDKLQLIVPKKRINYNYYIDTAKSCCFDTLYFCYDMNLSKDLIML